MRPRRYAGEFMSLELLAGVLPPDYLLTIKVNECVVWSGICWVFIYDKIYQKYRTYGVKSFNTDFYNEAVKIEIYLYNKEKRH